MLSVITPVFNSEQFIEDCILSVIAQKCDSVEHIIVDGGSSDRTVEIIQRYAARFEHIRWISETDRGQSDAMNKGIQLAQSDVIGFLNVDDYYEPGVLIRISQIFDEITSTPAFIVANCNILNESGEVLLVNKPRRMRLKDLVVIPRLNPAPCNPAAYFYHKSIHNIVGLYSLEEQYAMDLDFILRVASVVDVTYCDEIWGNFLLHQDTKTAQDINSGQIQQRMYELFKKYRSDLNFWERLQVAVFDGFSYSKEKLHIIKLNLISG